MHGPSECTGNIIHSCAIHLYSQQYYSKVLPFVSCLAGIVRGWDYLGKECAQKTGVSWPKIRACSKSEEGLQLLARNGEESDKLSPKNTYSPWMTINGRHSQIVETDDLVEFVCNRYRGPIKLKACEELSSSCPFN